MIRASNSRTSCGSRSMWKRWSSRWTLLFTAIAPNNLPPTRSELALRFGLVVAHSPRLDVGHVIVFAFQRSARDAPQDCNLAHVGQSIGNRPLKQLLEWKLHWFLRCQEVVELRKCGKDSLHLQLPRQRLRVLPLLLAHGDRQTPIKQISHMRQDLPRRAHTLPGLKFGETIRRVPHGFPASIGQRGQGVPQQYPLGVGGWDGMSRIVHSDRLHWSAGGE